MTENKGLWTLHGGLPEKRPRPDPFVPDGRLEWEIRGVPLPSREEFDRHIEDDGFVAAGHHRRSPDGRGDVVVAEGAVRVQRKDGTS